MELREEEKIKKAAKLKLKMAQAKIALAEKELEKAQLTAYEKRVVEMLESYKSPMDLVEFVRSSHTAQANLSTAECCDYKQELEFIETHDDCDIRALLDETNFYDSEYGNCDKLCAFRSLGEDLFWDLLGGYENCEHPNEMQQAFDKFWEK